LDPAGLLAGPVECLTAGVIDRHAVDEQPVVMEPWYQRIRGRSPKAILALLRGIPLAWKKTEFDLLGVRCLNPKRHPQVGVDAGILRVPNVAGGRDRVGELWILCLIRGCCQEKRQQAGKPNTIHQWTSF